MRSTAADSDDQLQLLGVPQRVHVHREEFAVQIPDRLVAELLVRPCLPVPEPLAERLADLRLLVQVLNAPDRQAVVPTSSVGRMIESRRRGSVSGSS